MALEDVLGVLSVLGWLGTVFFLAIYHRTSRWWAIGYGRALFVVVVVILIFFSTSVAYNLFGPDYPFRSGARVATLVIGTGVIWYLLVILVRSGAKARRAREDSNPLVRERAPRD